MSEQTSLALPDRVIQILKRPIDPAAISSAPRGLSSIKSIYITERLNEAFGLGGWFVHDEVVRIEGQMVVVKATMELTEYPWFHAASYGGNNNADLGDAYKGAVSDAISKMCAMYLGIAQDVFKGLASLEKPQTPPAMEKPVRQTPEGTKPYTPRKGGGENDASGDACISEGKAKRFYAIAIQSKHTKDEIGEAIAAAGLSDIKKCPWKGKTYENLIRWAEMEADLGITDADIPDNDLPF